MIASLIFTQRTRACRRRAISGREPIACRWRIVRCDAAPHRVRCLRSLHLDGPYIDAVEKAYNPDEPRVSAGSGRTSGEWTSSGAATGEAAAAASETSSDHSQGSSLLGKLALPASSFLGDLDAGQAAALGAYASRLLRLGSPGVVAAAAAAVFGLLFIPSPNDVRVDGDAPEIPGLHYSWNRDETVLHLTYDRSGGGRRTSHYK